MAGWEQTGVPHSEGCGTQRAPGLFCSLPSCPGETRCVLPQPSQSAELQGNQYSSSHAVWRTDRSFCLSIFPVFLSTFFTCLDFSQHLFRSSIRANICPLFLTCPPPNLHKKLCSPCNEVSKAKEHRSTLVAGKNL